MKVIKNSVALLATKLVTTEILVANKVDVVANKKPRSADRHKKTYERKVYMRDLMRRKREANKA